MCEKFERTEKIKGSLLFIEYLILIVFGGSVLRRTDITFLIDNMTFVVYAILFVTTVALFWNTYIISIKECFKDSERKFKSLAIVTVITLAGIIISAIILDKTGVVNQNNESIDADMAKGGIVSALMAVNTVVFAPIVEETIYRFFVFRFLRNKFRILSHIFVAALFGFSHVWWFVLVKGDLTQIFSLLPTFVMSIGFSASYIKTKSLAFPIMLHMVVNLISLLS